MNNMTTAANPSILLPVQNGVVAGCRKDDVRFVHVLCFLDFSNLFNIPNPGPTVLRASFYIQLPQSTQVMTGGNNVNYNLATWHGVADLSTLSLDDLCILVLKPCLQDGPITLAENDFNLTKANINLTKVYKDIYARIIKLGYKQICHAIFTQLCPGYSNQPHAALEHICQSAPGPDS